MCAKNINESYCVMEGVEALLTTLEKMGIAFNRDTAVYDYDKEGKNREIGQRVTILTEGIPNFEIKEDMLLISDFEWIVETIVHGYDNLYYTTFLLEDVI
jgi:hypothetical protein